MCQIHVNFFFFFLTILSFLSPLCTHRGAPDDNPGIRRALTSESCRRPPPAHPVFSLCVWKKLLLEPHEHGVSFVAKF